MPQLDRELAYADVFAASLLDPSSDAPSGLCGPRGKKAAKRYDVYRNNVTVSLIESLAAIYPVTKKITGNDFFRAMARFYVRANPPTSPLLFEYGRSFPEFVREYEYARSLSWLADIALLERVWLDAYHSADVSSVPPLALSEIPAEELGSLKFLPHPATTIIQSKHPIVTLYIANRDNKSGEVEPYGEDALITRPLGDVELRCLPAGGAHFLALLISGRTLGEAAAFSIENEPSFDLPANIAGMLQAGVFQRIDRENQP